MVQVVCRFQADELLDRLPSAYLVDPIALHPPCARDRLQQSHVALTAAQALADFTSTPAGALVLHVQDVVLHLKGKLMGVAIGTTASIRQPLHSAFLIT